MLTHAFTVDEVGKVAVDELTRCLKATPRAGCEAIVKNILKAIVLAAKIVTVYRAVLGIDTSGRIINSLVKACFGMVASALSGSEAGAEYSNVSQYSAKTSSAR